MGQQCGFFSLLALFWILTTCNVACRHTTRPSTHAATGIRTHFVDAMDIVDQLKHPILQITTMLTYNKQRRLEQFTEEVMSNHSLQRWFTRPMHRKEEVLMVPDSLPNSRKSPTREYNILYFNVFHELRHFLSPQIESASVNVFVKGTPLEVGAPLILGVYEQRFTNNGRTHYHYPLSACDYCLIITTWTLEQYLVGSVKTINVTRSGQWIEFELGQLPQRWLDNPLENRGLAVYNGTQPQQTWIERVDHLIHYAPYLHLKLSVRNDPNSPLVL